MAISHPEPLAVTLQVTQVLSHLGVRYFIAGSLASSFHGVIRTTQDADIVADLQSQHAAPFAEALKSSFFIDEEMVKEAIRRGTSFNILHRESMFKVDVFIPKPGKFAEGQFARAKAESLFGDNTAEAHVASAEDTILAKLAWYRQGNESSERQWRDVLGLIKVQGSSMDLDTLRRTGAELSVIELLDRALQQAEEKPET